MKSNRFEMARSARFDFDLNKYSQRPPEWLRFSLIPGLAMPPGQVIDRVEHKPKK